MDWHSTVLPFTKGCFRGHRCPSWTAWGDCDPLRLEESVKMCVCVYDPVLFLLYKDIFACWSALNLWLAFFFNSLACAFLPAGWENRCGICLRRGCYINMICQLCLKIHFHPLRHLYGGPITDSSLSPTSLTHILQCNTPTGFQIKRTGFCYGCFW